MPVLKSDATGHSARFVDRLTIGRSPDNDMVIDDPRVSGQHALIAFHEGRPRIMDLNSRNGTFVDGIRIGRWVDLVEGSQVRFGTAGPFVLEELHVKVEPGERAPVPTVAASDTHGKFRPTRLLLYSKDLGAGTMVVEQGTNRIELEGSMRFLLLYILAMELVSEPEATPEPNRGWLGDEQLRIKLWGVKGAERRDPSSLGKLIHDTRAMMKKQGIDPGFIEKRSGATRLCLLPSQIEMHTP